MVLGCEPLVLPLLTKEHLVNRTNGLDYVILGLSPSFFESPVCLAQFYLSGQWEPLVIFLVPCLAPHFSNCSENSGETEFRVEIREFTEEVIFEL